MGGTLLGEECPGLFNPRALVSSVEARDASRCLLASICPELTCAG
ncbi:hypothetical protein MFUL124B02_33170 [Myxococcus fulvus 124B02]|nr:hypothetical protein MFUL124B02_33170 [Myxococcus fulvus 124B02]